MKRIRQPLIIIAAAAAFGATSGAAAQDDSDTVELGGTTIIGDRELPIGLYISPWRSATPESDIDRPSRYLDVGTHPIDKEVFRRQTEYYQALDAAARQQ